MAKAACGGRKWSIRLLTLVVALSGGTVALRADPITPTRITVTGGFVEIRPGPTSGAPPELLGPQAEVLLTGLDGFRLAAVGAATTPACRFGCAPGQLELFGGPIYMTSGSVSFRGTTIPFNLYGDPWGSGDLNFTSDDAFTLPGGSLNTFVVQRSVSLQFGYLYVPGFVPPYFLTEPGPTGTATGYFTLGPGQGGSSAWQFERIRFEVSEPVPEPASLLLLSTGLAAAALARRRARRA